MKSATDSGWSPRILELMKKRVVTAGIHTDDDARDDGESNASIGMMHEFGLGVPQRSFMRSAFDENEAKIKKIANLAYGGAAKGRWTPDKAAKQIGEGLVAEIKEKIRTNIPPALADATVAAKGSTAALIDTGAMLNAIDFEVK